MDAIFDQACWPKAGRGSVFGVIEIEANQRELSTRKALS